MAFTNPTDSSTAVLTNKGRDELARLIMGEVSLQLTAFQVGRGGYNDSDPVKVDPIDPTVTALDDPAPDATDRRDFVIIEQPIGENVLAPICRLDPGESDVEYGLGELGIFATYLRDTVTPANEGTDFLFAIAHFPIISKTPSHTLLWRVVIAL